MYVMGAKITFIAADCFRMVWHLLIMSIDLSMKVTHYWDGYTPCFLKILRCRYVTSYSELCKNSL